MVKLSLEKDADVNAKEGHEFKVDPLAARHAGKLDPHSLSSEVGFADEGSRIIRSFFAIDAIRSTHRILQFSGRRLRSRLFFFMLSRGHFNVKTGC